MDRKSDRDGAAMMELYQFGDSPCCMKVRMVMAEKAIDRELKTVASYKFDHYQKEYQALNSHSLVPTLVHDGRIVIQSSNIAEYLDDVFPDPPLQPEDPFERSVMREWMKEEEEFLFPLIVTLSFNTMMKMRADGYGIDQLREWSLLHPDQERAQDYLSRVTSPADPDAMAAAEKKFRWHMERLERHLTESGGPWICGDLFSLAEICMAGIFDRIEYLDRDWLFGGLPQVESWVERLKARPSYSIAAHEHEDRMWGPLKPVPDAAAS
jgi:glutathione S-transferase